METEVYKDKKSMNIKDIAKEIRNQLKKEFSSCVFSVQIQRYSMGQSMTIFLTSASFEAILGERRRDFVRDANGSREVFSFVACDRQYAQLNHYTLKENFTDGVCNGTVLTQEAWNVMRRAYELTKPYNWDKSDSQTDYFDVNFYVHMAIGRWDKPFQVIK